MGYDLKRPNELSVLEDMEEATAGFQWATTSSAQTNLTPHRTSATRTGRFNGLRPQAPKRTPYLLTD